MIHKITSASAKLLNLSIVLSMVGIGAYSIRDASAKEIVNAISEEGKVCLQQNIFFEARNQSTLGQVAVAWVTINRMESSKYPATICNVVHQGRKDDNGNMIKHKCHFSWYCDGKSDKIPDTDIAQRAWEDAGLVAQVVLYDWAYGNTSPVEGSIMYHADYVEPYWADSYDPVVKIDDHIFYATLQIEEL
jgi:spore germination cell wall hydrolase CwlJ-like protein